MFYLVRLMLAAEPLFALAHPIKKWSAGAAMLGTFAYLLISGSSFATVRSGIMIAIMFFAVILDRPALALRNVVLAALIILVLFPESLFDVGFQMSFAAVVALISVYEALRGRGGLFTARGPATRLALFMGGIVLSTLIASAAVAPFAAHYFHKNQQYSVLANLVAIPICDLIVMPAALVALILMPLGLEALPLKVMGWGVDAMLWTAERVASLPGAVLHVPAIPTAAFLLMGRRPMAGAMADPLAACGCGAHRGRVGARADATPAGSAGRPRRCARRGARRDRPPGGGRRQALVVRVGALARA